MNIKKFLAVAATAVSLAAPLTLAGPADAAPAKTLCVRITAPGSHTVAVGDTRQIHVRLSKACLGAKVSFNDMPAFHDDIRHLLLSSTYYIPGAYTLTVRVTPPNGEGKVVSKAITYKVVTS